jgi:hypothetical protein
MSHSIHAFHQSAKTTPAPPLSIKIKFSLYDGEELYLEMGMDEQFNDVRKRIAEMKNWSPYEFYMVTNGRAIKNQWSPRKLGIQEDACVLVLSCLRVGMMRSIDLHDAKLAQRCSTA